MSYNPHVDENGNCVNCGTGQLNFDGKSTGCACSRVADAEYETEQLILELLDEACGCWKSYRDCWADKAIETIKQELSEKQRAKEIQAEIDALIKGENK